MKKGINADEVELTTLCCLEANEEAVIYGYKDQNLACKLISMGFLPGKTVKVVRKIWKEGNYYLNCNNQRIVIGHSEAQAIEVRTML